MFTVTGKIWKNNQFRSPESYLHRLLLIFAVLILFGMSCQKNTESQIKHISEASAKEETDMGDSDSEKEDFTNLRRPNYAIWEKKNPPRITIEATTDPQKKVLTLTYSAKNTTGEPICLFHYDTPFISLAPGQRVAFMNIIPPMPIGMNAKQFYPPVIRLVETDQTVTGKVSYNIPLYDTHPYGGSVNMFFPIKKETVRTEVGTNIKDRIKSKTDLKEVLRMTESMIKNDVSREALMYIGYFPEKDMKKGFRPGESIFLNGFRRQLLAKSKTIRLIVPVRLPLWIVELKTYWRK